MATAVVQFCLRCLTGSGGELDVDSWARYLSASSSSVPWNTVDLFAGALRTSQCCKWLDFEPLRLRVESLARERNNEDLWRGSSGTNGASTEGPCPHEPMHSVGHVKGGVLGGAWGVQRGWRHRSSLPANADPPNRMVCWGRGGWLRAPGFMSGRDGGVVCWATTAAMQHPKRMVKGGASSGCPLTTGIRGLRRVLAHPTCMRVHACIHACLCSFAPVRTPNAPRPSSCPLRNIAGAARRGHALSGTCLWIRRRSAVRSTALVTACGNVDMGEQRPRAAGCAYIGRRAAALDARGW